MKEKSTQTNLFTKFFKHVNIFITMQVISPAKIPRRYIMSTISDLKTASTAAEGIIAEFSGHVTEDAVEVRKAELSTLKKDELVARILELEKPKSKDGITVETVARKFMEAPELALFNWSQIALLVKRVLPEANTSSKSIASYASKRKEDWAIVPREKFSFDPAELMALGQ
jgi:hypothetical protein